MGIGDLSAVEVGACEGLYCLDIGMFDVEQYGCVYVLDAERPALVETGLGRRVEAVLDALDAVGVARDELAVIAPTHVHLDHAGGAGYLAAACPNAEVVVPERGARHLVDPSRLWEGTKRAVGDQIRFYAEPEPVDEERVRTVTDGDVIDLGDHVLEVHGAPGHAPHQAVYYDAPHDALFTADAAGIYVPERDAVHPTTPPPNFDFEQALEDVRTLQTIDPETLLYTHFGPAPRGDRLAEYVEVLTEWVEAVAEARAERDDDAAVVEHFAESTGMDDVWTEDKASAEVGMNVRGVLAYLDAREESSTA